MPAAAVVVQRERAAQQRAPRQVDGHEVRDARKLARQRLRRGHDEQRVRQATPRGRPAARRDASAIAVGDGRRCRGRAGRGRRRGRQHAPAVAGAEVHDDAAQPAASTVELADVHLGTRRPITVRMRRGCAYAIGRSAGRRPRAPRLHCSAMSELPDPPLRARCPRRSIRGIRGPRTSPATSRGWSRRRGPGRVVEHVGSSSVPGHARQERRRPRRSRRTPTRSPTITDALLSLGFGRQAGLAPFPPTRPMLLGNVVHDGTSFRVHLHVMPPARDELARAASRSATRCAPTPRCATGTPRPKQRIVEAAPDGDANQLYTVHKGDFVQDALYRLGIRKGRPTRPSRCRPARRSGSWAAGSSAGCSALAARAMGYRLVVLDPDPDCPAAAGRRRDRRRRATTTSTPPGGSAAMADVVTYELEHVGLEAAAAAGELAPLRPGLARPASDPGPARRAAVPPRDRRVRRAVARGPRRRRGPRPPPTPSATRPAQGAARRVRRPEPGPDRGSRAGVDGAVAVARRRDGRPAAAGARDRLRGRAVGASAPATATGGRSPSRSRATSTTRGSSSRASAPAADPPARRRRRRARSPTGSPAASTSSAC